MRFAGQLILLRVIKKVLIFFIVVVASYYIIYPHVFRCQTIRYSDFYKLGKKTWVSPHIMPDNSHRIQYLINAANKRNQNFWGKIEGKATIILCATPEEYERFCHSDEGAGCSISTPLGDSYIVLNIASLNVDVASHEICHDELYSRLGWWNATFAVPQWFHEGLALMLDYRFVASQDSILKFKGYEKELKLLEKRGYEPIELSEISSMKGFFGGDQFYINRSYMTAGREVGEWLALAGRESLPLLISEVNKGKDFQTTYFRLKQK